MVAKRKTANATLPTPRQIQVSFPEAVVEQMNAQLKLAVLPDEPPFPGASWDLGVDLQWLKLVRGPARWVSTGPLS